MLCTCVPIVKELNAYSRTQADSIQEHIYSFLTRIRKMRKFYKNGPMFKCIIIIFQFLYNSIQLFNSFTNNRFIVQKKMFICLFFIINFVFLWNFVMIYLARIIVFFIMSTQQQKSLNYTLVYGVHIWGYIQSELTNKNLFV